MSVGFVATPMTTFAADLPPPNDAFASATPWTTYVPEDPAQFAGTAWTGSLVGASTETGEPGTATRTIWYRVGSTAGGVLALSDNLAAGLSQALYEGTSVDDLTLVPLISDNSGTVWATLEPGNQYQLQVSASAELAAGGLFYLFGQPSNDTFAGARLLGPAGTTQARLLAATREPGEPSPADCASAPKTEWYAITPANASRLDMTLVGPFNPSALATCLTLYEGSSLGGLSQLATATASGGLATIGRNLAAGTTYHIAVAGGSLVNPGRDFPTYGLTWLLSNHPPNDAFASATPWTTYVPEDPAQFAGTAWTGSLVGASTETGEPGTATRTIWYRVGSTAGGVLALSDNLAAGLSQALYEGTSVDDLTLVPLISDNSGTVWATLEPGNQYQLQVSASAELAAGGLFYLFGQPSNDTFAGARLLGPAGTTQARLLAATREPGEPSPADCASAPKTEWYAITPANASRLDMTLVGPFNPSALATCLTLYEGSSLGGLSQLATATASGGLATIGRNLAAGTTYHIAVAGGSLVNPGRDFPTYGLTWSLTPPTNDAPSITGATVVVAEDGSVTIDLATSDPDDDPLTYPSTSRRPTVRRSSAPVMAISCLSHTRRPRTSTGRTASSSRSAMVSSPRARRSTSRSRLSTTPRSHRRITPRQRSAKPSSSTSSVTTPTSTSTSSASNRRPGRFGERHHHPRCARTSNVRALHPQRPVRRHRPLQLVVGDGAGGTATGQVDVVVRDVTAP